MLVLKGLSYLKVPFDSVLLYSDSQIVSSVLQTHNTKLLFWYMLGGTISEKITVNLEHFHQYSPQLGLLP